MLAVLMRSGAAAGWSCLCWVVVVLLLLWLEEVLVVVVVVVLVVVRLVLLLVRSSVKLGNPSKMEEIKVLPRAIQECSLQQ